MATPSVYSVHSCNECELQAQGRCPTCRHGLCTDHFPLAEHEPCASRLAAATTERMCYVCGTPVTPYQWSAATFAHYVDAHTCAGCNRYICDIHHTRHRSELIKVVRDGLRSNRYHLTVRYCAVCAPVRRLGGLVGATWWLVAVCMAGAAAFYLLQP